VLTSCVSSGISSSNEPDATPTTAQQYVESSAKQGAAPNERPQPNGRAETAAGNAKVNIAAVKVVNGGNIERIRIVVNGAAAHPWRLKQVEDMP
jgi:hypothetical protein